MSTPVTIGLDIGGTKVAGGLVDAAGAVVVRVERPSLVDGRRDPASAVTLAVARELMARAAALGLRVDGIGAGFPEYVDPDGRLTSHEVLAWTDQPAGPLGALAPATVESDVRCGALAEATRGAGRGSREVAYVSAGTGLSHAGEATAVALLERTGGALGAGLAILARLLDPDVIVLGGGLGAAGGPWRAALDAAYVARTASRPDAPPIVVAALGADAGIIGAAIMHRRAADRG